MSVFCFLNQCASLHIFFYLYGLQKPCKNALYIKHMFYNFNIFAWRCFMQLTNFPTVLYFSFSFFWLHLICSIQTDDKILWRDWCYTNKHINTFLRYTRFRHTGSKEDLYHSARGLTSLRLLDEFRLVNNWLWEYIIDGPLMPDIRPKNKKFREQNPRNKMEKQTYYDLYKLLLRPEKLKHKSHEKWWRVQWSRGVLKW